MINQLYLQKASNIRKDYIDIIHNIKKYEEIAGQLSESVELRMHELENLLADINSKKISSVDVAKRELENIMISTEIDMNKVDKQIDSLVIKMDSLKEEEKSLYRDIRQTYPEKSDEDLKIEIHKYLQENNLS